MLARLQVSRRGRLCMFSSASSILTLVSCCWLCFTSLVCAKCCLPAFAGTELLEAAIGGQQACVLVSNFLLLPQARVICVAVSKLKATLVQTRGWRVGCERQEGGGEDESNKRVEGGMRGDVCSIVYTAGGSVSQRASHRDTHNARGGLDAQARHAALQLQDVIKVLVQLIGRHA